MNAMPALLRYYFRLVWGRALVVGILATAVALPLLPTTLRQSVFSLAYLVVILAPAATLVTPSTAERCLPVRWAQLRLARLAVHLGIACGAVVPIAALAWTMRWEALVSTSTDELDGGFLILLALLIPIWPCLAHLLAPLIWRSALLRPPWLAAGIIAAGVIAWLLCAAVLALASIVLPGPLLLGLACAFAVVALVAAMLASPRGEPIDPRPSPGTAARAAALNPGGTTWPATPALGQTSRRGASLADRIPPIPRALLRGLWLRPGYLVHCLLSLVVAVLSALSLGASLMMLILLATDILQIHRLGEATIGGRLSRRTGLAALLLPPLALFALGYGLTVACTTPWSSRVSFMLEDTVGRYLAQAYPRRDHVRLPSGQVVPVEDLPEADVWLARRTTPAFLAQQAERQLERDEWIDIPAAELRTPDGASTDAAKAQVLRALQWRRVLLGLGLVTATAVFLALAVPSRRILQQQRDVFTWRVVVLFLGLGMASLVPEAVARLQRSHPIPMPGDGALPALPLPWWDHVAAQCMSHATTTACSLLVLTALCVVLAWHSARWLPLDLRARTGGPFAP